MELRHLRYFVATAEERSITRAAERLWIAQPGLSTQIRRLESELGIRLFERHTRGVDLTAAGELFLSRARETLAAADRALSTGRSLEAGTIGTVRLGLAAETPAAVVPALLAAFSRDRPEVDVTVLESYAGTVLRDLRDGRLDAMIAPSSFASAELLSVPLASEPWVVLVGPGHLLAAPGPIAAHDLHGVRVVVTGHRDGAGYDRAVARTLTELGVTPVLDRVGPGPALHAAVADGSAVALSTASAASGDEIVRTLEPTRAISFALARRDETAAPALSALIGIAEAGLVRSLAVSRPTLVSAA